MSSLPIGWISARVGDVAELRLGKMLDKQKNQGDPFKYLRNINVRWFQFDLSDLQTMLASDKESDVLSVRNGDLFVCEGGEPGRCAVWRNGPNELVFQKALHRLRTSNCLLPEFLMYQLRYDAETGKLKEACSGTTIKHLTRENLYDYQIAVAPLAEQKRIADKLHTVLARVDACQERLNHVPLILKRFRQAVLAAAVSGRLTADWRRSQSEAEPRRLKTCELREIARIIDPNPSHRYPSYENGTIPLFATEQMRDIDAWDVSTAKLTSADFWKEREMAHGFEPSDIVFARKGRLGLARRPPNIQKFVFSHTVFLVRNVSAEVCSEYLLWFLRQDAVVDWLVAEMNSNTGVPTLGKAVMERLPITLPPLAEQLEIVRRVESHFAFAGAIEARLNSAVDAINKLTPALLAKAFRGELVPQDPNDEPAAELLRRLAKQRSGEGKDARGKRAAPVALNREKLTSVE